MWRGLCSRPQGRSRSSRTRASGTRLRPLRCCSRLTRRRPQPEAPPCPASSWRASPSSRAGSLGIGIREELLHPLGRDLPGEPVLVLEPAARAFLAAFGELRPVVVDFVLVLTADLEGNGLVELELGAAVDTDEALTAKLELDDHDHARLARRVLGVRDHAHDAPILEDGDVELGSRLSLRVEP